MSEIVDPIVVTPGKELETPEFFKKDIERISGEVFDKKIVNVPSGTKLYLHNLGTLSFGAPNYVVTIISTKKTPYSSINDIGSNEKIVRMYVGDGVGSEILAKMIVTPVTGAPKYGFYAFSLSQDGSITVYTTGAITEPLSDTVTEL